MRPSDFDNQYPVGFGKSISIENLNIDYSAASGSTDPCWLVDIVPFSKNKVGQRLFFPSRLNFRNIAVTGREQGIRLIRIPDPFDYILPFSGGCDNRLLSPNCKVICDNVQLEKIIGKTSGDPEQVHLLIGGEQPKNYADNMALYPKIVFRDCENVSLLLSQCAASVHFERCTVNTINARNLSGALNFNNCSLLPVVSEIEGPFYILESSLGTRFTNCTIHAPVINDAVSPDLFDNIGFLKINKSIRHFHLNTSLGTEVVDYLKKKGIKLNSKFIGLLKVHHDMEEQQ
jgi:hypothetical protein